MRRTGKTRWEGLSLDSLVDIVSNNVGILVILAAFMAMFSLADPNLNSESKVGLLREKQPRKLLVPWSHPTTKQHLFLAMRDNRLQLIDLRPFYHELRTRKPDTRPEPVSFDMKGFRIRFFPVTNQIYCLEFNTKSGFGENWLQAQRPDSAWRKMLQEFPRERYTLFFWVSGESFDLFRQVRQTLWELNYEVGWKPARKDAPLEICNGFEGSSTFRPQ